MGGGPKAKARHEHLLFSLPYPEPEDFLASIREEHPNITVSWHQSSPSKPSDLFSACTILATLSDLPANPSKDAPNLRWVHFLSAGIDHILKHPIYTDSDVVITTSNGVAAPQIAEWVIMNMLARAHNFGNFYDLQKEHRWFRGKEFSSDDYVGQRIGILGYGSIGRHVGRLSKAMGMSVIAYTATPKDTAEKKKDDAYIVPGAGDPDGVFPDKWYSGLDKESLHEFLRQDLDVIVLTLPLTNDTRHMIGPTEFSILSKKHAYIANISRGPIIQQDALIAAIKAGDLRGAALDVTDPEPLPADSELWGLPNVIVTPHVSGSGNAYVGRALQLLDVSLGRWENGEKPLNVVNRKRGY